MQKLLNVFSKNIYSLYGIFDDQSFNDMLTNNIFSFEQLGPECYRGVFRDNSWRNFLISL